MISFGSPRVTVRPKIKRKLSCGQTVEHSPQDEKMLWAAYDYMQGYSKRRAYETRIEQLKGTSSPSTEEGVKTLEMLRELEEKYTSLIREDLKISPKDLEVLIAELGVSTSMETIRHMIYEVDELVDEMISWDEFVLAYHRNVSDNSGSEPSNFFRLMEFVLFDPHHKGRIVEDDVMEVLFARIGAARLEEELQSIFGNSRRANGGDGTISLQQYLNACVMKDGRRALVF